MSLSHHVAPLFEGSLYIHIPFCNRKCIYCDFYSGGARIADWPRLRLAIGNELKYRSSELPEVISSIYFGGGTPSLIPSEIFSGLVDDIKKILTDNGTSLSNDLEFTIEANPEDVDIIKMEAWRRAGVNRVSLGVQTFNDILLKAINRSHSANTARRALELLSSYFENISADLIFDLPGETKADLASDLKELILLRPKHISVYSLMYEEGTSLTELRNKGCVKEADEKLSTDMFIMIGEILRNAGYERYEISNYCIPGAHSRHNSGYWTGRRYLGLGPSAHSYDGQSIRRANPADLKGYLRRFAPVDSDKVDAMKECPDQHLDKPFYKEERLTRDELMEERIMLGLRTSSGISLTAFEKEYGVEALIKLRKAAAPNIGRGLAIRRDNLSNSESLILTEEGIMIADSLILSLI